MRNSVACQKGHLILKIVFVSSNVSRFAKMKWVKNNETKRSILLHEVCLPHTIKPIRQIKRNKWWIDDIKYRNITILMLIMAVFFTKQSKIHSKCKLKNLRRKCQGWIGCWMAVCEYWWEKKKNTSMEFLSDFITRVWPKYQFERKNSSQNFGYNMLEGGSSIFQMNPFFEIWMQTKIFYKSVKFPTQETKYCSK